MNILFFIVAVIEAVAVCIVGLLYFRSLHSLKRFETIADVESHQRQCEESANAATAHYQNLTAQSHALSQQVHAQKGQVAQYQKFLGNLKTAADLQQKIATDTQKVQQLATALGGLQHASQLATYIQNQEATIAQNQSQLNAIAQALGGARTASEIAAQVTYFQNLLAVTKAEVDSVEEARGLQEFGFYRPRYNFDSSEEYETRLDSIRAQQKTMLSMKSACVCATEWTVDGNKREGQKMVDKQVKLMLRAFNGESDAAVGKVRYNNVVSLEKRITKAFEQINKLGESQRTWLTPEFCNLKYSELHLAYEYQQKKEDEKEAQRALREIMKEEEKVAREIEKACEDAERDEEVKSRALEKARIELEQRAGFQTAKLEALVLRLENELHEAIDRKARAIARAQLTKSGHVYILSNVGTFGEDVYKIGMSRRLEPLERVNELGGASVPFPFDVHAMIYSEDAPKLEALLHRHFANRRVNMVNLRREFFHVSLDEIRAAVAEYFGRVTFVTIPEAAQFRETQALRKALEIEASRLQIA